MRVARLLGILAIGFVAVASAAAAGPPLQIVEAGQAHFPFRSYVLTLPKAQALPLARLHLTEDGTPVHNPTVTSAGAGK